MLSASQIGEDQHVGGAGDRIIEGWQLDSARQPIAGRRVVDGGEILVPSTVAGDRGRPTGQPGRSSGSFAPRNAFDGDPATFYDHNSATPYMGWGSNTSPTTGFVDFVHDHRQCRPHSRRALRG
jgi:hypothetical protein